MKTSLALRSASAALLLASASASAGGYGVPHAYGMPGPHAAPGYGVPGYAMPGYGMPMPGWGAPAYGQPPGYGQRGYGQRGGYGQPGYGMQPYQQPGRAGPAYGEPAAPGGRSGATAAPTPTDDAGAQSDDTVSVSGMQFRPATLEVEQGETVTWNFPDAVPHTVTARDGDFSSARLMSGGTFEHTFEEPGEYAYYCSIHPNMTGTIIVE